MYTLKGFVNIDGLANSAADTVAAIGEISSKSLTYAKGFGEYTNSSYPLYTVYSFLTATSTGTITIPTALQTQIFAVIDWAYQYQKSSSAATSATGFTAAMVAQFGTAANSIGCGSLISNGSIKFPEYITWVNPDLETNDTATGGLVKLWFCDASFQDQYDEYEIVVIPPLSTLNTFFSGSTAVAAAIAAYTYSDTINAVQTAQEDYKATLLVAHQYAYVDPSDSTNRITTNWTLLIYGEAGNNIDAISAAIQAYLLANSDYTAAQWAVLFPDIYNSTEFYLIPRWKNIAIPSQTLTSGAYSSVVNLAKELAYVKSIFSSYSSTFIESHLAVIPCNYKSLELLVLPSSDNADTELDIGTIFDDIINVPTSDTLFNMMASTTRAWITMILELIIEAEDATAESTLPSGMSRVTRNNVLFITKEYSGVNYLVATKNSTPSYS